MQTSTFCAFYLWQNTKIPLCVNLILEALTLSFDIHRSFNSPLPIYYILNGTSSFLCYLLRNNNFRLFSISVVCIWWFLFPLSPIRILPISPYLLYSILSKMVILNFTDIYDTPSLPSHDPYLLTRWRNVWEWSSWVGTKMNMWTNNGYMFHLIPYGWRQW